MTGNQLDIFRIASNETALISSFHNVESEESIISIASGERQITMPVLNDDYCEELAHPHLLRVDLDMKLKDIYLCLQVNISINPCFLDYTQQFSSDSDYIFAHSVL